MKKQQGLAHSVLLSAFTQSHLQQQPQQLQLRQLQLRQQRQLQQQPLLVFQVTYKSHNMKYNFMILCIIIVHFSDNFTCPSKERSCIAADGHSNVIFQTSNSKSEKNCGSKFMFNICLLSHVVLQHLDAFDDAF